MQAIRFKCKCGYEFTSCDWEPELMRPPDRMHFNTPMAYTFCPKCNKRVVKKYLPKIYLK